MGTSLPPEAVRDAIDNCSQHFRKGMKASRHLRDQSVPGEDTTGLKAVQEGRSTGKSVETISLQEQLPQDQYNCFPRGTWRRLVTYSVITRKQKSGTRAKIAAKE